MKHAKAADWNGTCRAMRAAMPGYTYARSAQRKSGVRRECPWKAGDRIRAKPESGWDGTSPGGGRQEYAGTVAYVHPQGRWILAVFEIGHAQVRECFAPQEVQHA